MDKLSENLFSFDQDYLRRTKKGDFIKVHPHLAEIIDLPAVWEEANKKGTPKPQDGEG